MYKVLCFLIPSLCFAAVIDTNNGLNDTMSTEGVRSYGQSSSTKEDVNAVLENILTDPDRIISRSFYVPEKLKGRVLFWVNIYAIYPLSTAIIHDKSDPAIVYEVLDLSYVFNDKRLSQAGKEVRFNKLVEDKKREIKNILKDISRTKNPNNFLAKTSGDRKIKNIVIRAMKKGADIKNAWQNVRVQTGQKDSILDGLKSSFKYLPVIEDIFKESGLPWELTRIPFVESSFNIRANSKVGAKGIWQIMGETGKNFMQTTSFYDERYSPFKASAVAAKLLKENYGLFNSWPLAITAYNCGPSSLQKASKQLKTKDINAIISGYKGKSFGFASQNFYSEFLAALYVTVYYEKIFGHIERGNPLSFYYVAMDKDISVKDLAEISGLSTGEIASYNPELSTKMLKGEMPVKKGSKMKLPPRASYKVEDYFVKISDKYELKKQLKIDEPEND